MLSGVYRFPAMESVVFGKPFVEALAQEVDRAEARAVFVLASGTLARETDAVDRLRGMLGNRLAGVCAKIGAHTPRSDVVAAANTAREAGADLIVTLGGGSVTDAAKMVALCLGNGITEAAQLDDYRARIAVDGTTRRPQVEPPSVRSITIPTTLSAGEYTASAGCTDTVRHVKESYSHPLMMPRTVILDPDIGVHTPQWLFLSTGIRAVDHAVEDICSVNGQPIAEGASYHALRLLGAGLPAVNADPSNLEARLDCQIGAWMSMVGSQTGVSKGASHGIGHVLGGTAGVPHGYTSCVMLPHVLRFNHPVNAGQQARVSEALGQPEIPAADAVAALIAGLGLPTRLRDVGVAPEQLDRIAEGSMHDRWIHTNPRKIDGPAVIRILLDAAW
ncbi:MAG: iron-containing alcohol dehydrogenase [Alphaproteobacteria bacterium]|nr:MAG: iron-containing alcohol dehydrogenase [Alphaproteobacteria bacterium]